MTAFLVGHITVKDAKLWQEYVAGAQNSLSPFKSKIIFRGKLDAVLAGKHDHNLVVLIEFNDLTTLNDWFHSEEYQSLIPIRDKAANVVITSYGT